MWCCKISKILGAAMNTTYGANSAVRNIFKAFNDRNIRKSCIIKQKKKIWWNKICNLFFSKIRIVHQHLCWYRFRPPPLFPPSQLIPDNKYADFEASTTLEQNQYKDIFNMHWNKKNMCIKKNRKKIIRKIY